MLVGVMGVSHKSAPLLLQERATASIKKQAGRVVLSTCSRTEVYFSQNDVPEMHADYSFFGIDCFSYLARVTAGLESPFLLETAIQSQVKLSYEAARAVPLPSPLHYLFQKSLKLAKDVRSRFPLFQSKCQLEALICKLIDAFLSKNPSLLFIGFSDVNRRLIHYLSRRKKGCMTLVSRGQHNAHSFAMRYGLTLKTRDELSNAHLYDAVISATESEERYILSTLQAPLRTQLMLDLSVPRTLDPDLIGIPGLTLLNMQQLGELFAKTHPAQEMEIAKINNFIDSAVLAYTERFEQKNLVCV